jgi:hypothetical protein
MNEALVTEYVELWARLAALDVETEAQVYARLDHLWYAEMTFLDRVEAEQRLRKLSVGRDDRRMEKP